MPHFKAVQYALCNTAQINYKDAPFANVNFKIFGSFSLFHDDCGPVLSSTKPPRAGTLSPAGPYDNNKEQFDFGIKMQK